MPAASASGTTRLSCDRVAFNTSVGRPKVESSALNLWSPSPETRLSSIQAARSPESFIREAPRTGSWSGVLHGIYALHRPCTLHNQRIGTRIERTEDED